MMKLLFAASKVRAPPIPSPPTWLLQQARGCNTHALSLFCRHALSGRRHCLNISPAPLCRHRLNLRASLRRCRFYPAKQTRHCCLSAALLWCGCRQRHTGLWRLEQPAEVAGIWFLSPPLIFVLREFQQRYKGRLALRQKRQYDYFHAIQQTFRSLMSQQIG